MRIEEFEWYSLSCLSLSRYSLHLAPLRTEKKTEGWERKRRERGSTGQRERGAA